MLTYALLGLLLLELSYVFQLARVAQRRSAADLSVAAVAANLAGRVVALGYAIEIGSSPFAVALIVGVVLHATLLLQVNAFRALPDAVPKPAASFDA